MLKHLSDAEIKGYVLGTVPAEKLLQFDDHMTNCHECRSAAADSILVGDRALQDALGQPGPDEHLSFDQRAAYAESRLDHVEREIADLHLNDCTICYEQVSDLLLLRKELGAVPVAAKDAQPFWQNIWTGIRAFRFRALAIPSAAVLLAGILFMAWFIGNRSTGDEVATVEPPDSDVEVVVAPPNTDPPAEPDNVQNTVVDKSKAVVSLNDGNGQIEMDAAGKISGISDPRFERMVASALAGKRVEIAPELRQLRQSAGSLMGSGQSGVPFSLKQPIGTIVETRQPQLRWEALKDADTYRVEVYDEGFNRVASSPSIQNAGWQVNVPLRRGVVYRWQVTAVVNGEEVKSPVRPAPDAKFKVLDAAAANKLADARARNGRSHLLLGLLYAESGLLDDATREFQILVRKNPDSSVARRLLERVRSVR